MSYSSLWTACSRPYPCAAPPHIARPTAAEGDYKHKIVQRGAVPPLIDMLGNDDNQVCAGRAAQRGQHGAPNVSRG